MKKTPNIILPKQVIERLYFWKALRGENWISLYPVSKMMETKALAYVQLSEYLALYPEEKKLQWILCVETKTTKISVEEDMNKKELKKSGPYL